ncbi:MAG TPA: hypothetical protein QF353_03485 [Gammaproteobacteria bacterium]|nr:hypothetical protein [Gammaproteobacteria bacterium]
MRVDWYQLILDAQMCRGITLGDDQVWYLCSILEEHMRDVHMVDFYAYECWASNQNDSASLKLAGDFSIISAGFFPDRFSRYGVSRDYYLLVGRNAYERLAGIYYIKNKKHFRHYKRLADNVVGISAVLEAASKLGGK